MNALALSRYSFTLRFAADTALPPFVGNTIRGALGRSLDNLGSPAYEKIFKIDSVESIPNPYTVSVPYPSKGFYRKDDTLTFAVTLFGGARGWGSDIMWAARNMCAGKLSNCVLEGGGLDYDRMWSDNGAETIPRCEELTINFLTPTEILSGKEPIREVDFNTLIDSLFGRIGGIIDNYTEGEFVIPYSLFARRPFVKAEYNLRPINFQTSGQPIYGFLGAVRYLGDVTRYLPYIDLGSQIHMGKKTTRACGEYSFEI